MKPSLRMTALASVLLVGMLTLAGCGTASEEPTAPEAETPEIVEETTGPESDDEFEVEAAWLDNGRMAGIVTWGSSSCLPVAGDITGDGQTVTVVMEEPNADQPCTADLAPRATLVTLPEGVDPTRDVEFIVQFGTVTEDAELDGNAALTGTPGETTDFEPSAGWFDDDALVLLTWGSSTCPPVVEGVELSGTTGTVTFVTEAKPCTKDMAPRTTIVQFADLNDGAEDSFELVLVGGDLDATLRVIED